MAYSRIITAYELLSRSSVFTAYVQAACALAGVQYTPETDKQVADYSGFASAINAQGGGDIDARINGYANSHPEEFDELLIEAVRAGAES